MRASNGRIEPCSASIESAAAMSAARASRSAPASASAATAVDTCVPLISASPSFGPSATGARPAARERVARPACARVAVPHLAFADQHERDVRERREVAARADRSAARHARMHAALSAAISASSVSRRMPEKPLASTLARSAIDARTARTGSGSPTPAAWLRSRLTCSCARSSRSMRVSANDPKPVLMP